MKKKIKVYDYKGIEKEKIDFEVPEVKVKNPGDLISQYVRTFLLNKRQGTAKAKTRGEVRGGGKKPWQQKGLGRARAGTIRSPLWRGGGIVHPPVPRTWNLKIQKKVKAKIFSLALFSKLDADKILVFEFPSKAKISTKDANAFLNKVKIKEKVLILHVSDDAIHKSFRNIKNTSVKKVSDVAAFDFLSTSRLLIEKNAISKLAKRAK